jgi:arylsulfatase A-like enzyme
MMGNISNRVAAGLCVWTILTVSLGAGAQDSLPRPLAPFAGKIGPTIEQSTPDWPKVPQAPKGAPNVLLILTDDVGFAATATFGGPAPTPNFDKLAASGLKYTEFHTTALCSPTRAALLTGRNHHEVGYGSLEDTALGFPGYSGIMPRSAATIGEILKDNGYNTAFFGKHHNTPASQATAAGPFDLWPTGLGFEYFYGFQGGDADQWQPRLFRNTARAPDLPAGEILDHALADDIIHYLHNQKAAAPDKPFFVYYAPGSGHAPHQAPADWIARFKGQFDGGWDVLRQQSFERQKKLGIVPADAMLTPRPADLPAWDSLSPERKAIDARFMEVYAAVIAYQDAQIGRVIDELRRMGQLDNTLVIYIAGDNGASGEGTPDGTLNEIGMLANGVRSTDAALTQQIDKMGGPQTYELYPAGWAWALNTPFQWMKQVASHLGGIRNGMVVSWPAKITVHGELRSQFSHVVDIAPTILEAAGLTAPKTVSGVEQQPIEGVSLAYSFADPKAAERHTTQYFEMLGNRAIYHDGWMANTLPKRLPWVQMKPEGSADTSYVWQLYDLHHDYSQAHDLAAAEPAKLKALQDLWWSEAKRNQVLPLDDDFGVVRSSAHTMAYATDRTDFTFWGKDVSVAQGTAPSLALRSFTVEAKIRADAGTTGVLMADGSGFGGWAFYLKNGVPVAYEAVSQNPAERFRVAGSQPVPAGAATVTFAFDRDAPPAMGGTMRISVNGAEVGRGHIDRTINLPSGLGETFDVGSDTGATVSDEYPGAGAFGGEIDSLTVHLGPVMMPKAFDATVKKTQQGAE